MHKPINRRRLLKACTGAALLPLLPYATCRAAAYNKRRVILLELAGANDGLNTLVPYTDDRYFQLRPTIAQRKVIELNADFGFHQALIGLMPLWENGELAAIHGLGYPAPNRSHFKSIALWETGGDGNKSGREGWATHDIEHAYASTSVDAHGIALGGGMGVFSNAEGNWLSMTTADQYNDLTNPLIVAADANGNEALTMLLENARILQSSLGRLSSKMGRLHKRVRIPGGGLSQQMTHAVNIINADINVPVIKLSLGGFDTHENQLNKQKALLTQAARAISGLRSELIKTSQWNNTLLITYSEFGRRAAENMSGGTDHGTAATHLVAGGGIRGGLYGSAPDLGQLLDGDLQHTMDYRALYSAVLSDWLQLPSDQFSVYNDRRLSTLIS